MVLASGGHEADNDIRRSSSLHGRVTHGLRLIDGPSTVGSWFELCDIGTSSGVAIRPAVVERVSKRVGHRSTTTHVGAQASVRLRAFRGRHAVQALPANVDGRRRNRASTTPDECDAADDEQQRRDRRAGRRRGRKGTSVRS